MAKALSKQRAPHTAECSLNNPKAEKELRRSCNCGNNPLNEADFTRMRIPRHLWGASLGGVPVSVRESIANYLKNICKAKASGGSLLLHGVPGVGKTGTGVVVLKEARTWGFSTYATTSSELREAVRAHTTFDYESSVYEWCRTVDFLLLDDLGKTDAAEKFFTLNDIRGLILSRQDRGLITIITSTLDVNAWRLSGCDSFADALYTACLPLEITGDDLRDAAIETKAKLFK
jgi:DNA replication protein DnaC